MGKAGVTKMLEIVRAELDTTMALCGPSSNRYARGMPSSPRPFSSLGLTRSTRPLSAKRLADSHGQDGNIQSDTGPGLITHILRSKDLVGLPESRVDVSGANTTEDEYSWSGNYPDRRDYSLGTAMLKGGDAAKILDEIAYFSSLHLWPGFDGKWTMRKRDRTRDAEHYLEKSDIAVRNIDVNTGKVRSWESDMQVSYRPAADILTDVFVRYGYDHAVDNFSGNKGLRSRWVSTSLGGTADGDVDGYTFTALSATFITDGVKPGMKVSWPTTVSSYGHVDIVVASVDSETQITLAQSLPADSGFHWAVGASLWWPLVWARHRYGVDRSLGQQADSNIYKVGGYTTIYTKDETSALSFAFNVAQFMSEAWALVEVGTHWNALPYQLGDVLVFNHDALPPHLRPSTGGTLNGAHTDSVGTLTLQTGEGANYTEGQYVVVGGEVMLVGTPGADSIPVTRAQADTVGVAHSDGDAVEILPVKWEVQGIRYDLARCQIRVRLQQMPAYY